MENIVATSPSHPFKDGLCVLTSSCFEMFFLEMAGSDYVQGMLTNLFRKHIVLAQKYPEKMHKDYPNEAVLFAYLRKHIQDHLQLTEEELSVHNNKLRDIFTEQNYHSFSSMVRDYVGMVAHTQPKEPPVDSTHY